MYCTLPRLNSHRAWRHMPVPSTTMLPLRTTMSGLLVVLLGLFQAVYWYAPERKVLTSTVCFEVLQVNGSDAQALAATVKLTAKMIENFSIAVSGT